MCSVSEITSSWTEKTSRIYRKTPPQPHSYPDLHAGELLRTLPSLGVSPNHVCVILVPHGYTARQTGSLFLPGRQPPSRNLTQHDQIIAQSWHDIPHTLHNMEPTVNMCSALPSRTVRSLLQREPLMTQVSRLRSPSSSLQRAHPHLCSLSVTLRLSLLQSLHAR